MRVSGSLVALLCCSALAALAAAGPGPGQEVPGRAPQDPASTSWLDHRFTKQGATLNEIWAKVVPFMTVADAGHDLPTGQLLLLGWCGWMAFLCAIAAWVVRATPSPAFAPVPPARGARSRRSVVCLPDRSAREIEVVRVLAVVLSRQPLQRQRHVRAAETAGSGPVAQAHQTLVDAARVEERGQQRAFVRRADTRAKRRKKEGSVRASSLCEHQTHFIVGRRVLALPPLPASTCRQAKRSSHARTAVCAAFLCSSTLLPNRCRIPVSHAFPTPGVSWAGKTVFGRP